MSAAERAVPDTASSVALRTLGWREWVSLPRLGIHSLKAKLDSGARSSSLSVQDIETFHVGGILHVRFGVRARRHSPRLVACEAPVVDRRLVTDSGGHRGARWFIAAELVVGGQHLDIEMNLTDRRAMLFPLLLGRSTLEGRFRIDPALSYTLARPRRSEPVSLA